MSKSGPAPSGLLTAVLANHWVDDGANRDGAAWLLALLGRHFDLVLQSCRTGHRVPEAAMLSCALQHLGVTSQQVGAPLKLRLGDPVLSRLSAGFRPCGWMQMRRGWRQQAGRG